MAAATTSLPASIGAGRNWDYRFCWLRDASVTMHAFLGLGLQEEADAFIGWLLNATGLTRPELRILYDLLGRNDATELDLAGYRDSRPVRVGNGAGDQLQLDTYGSVILAAYEYIARMGVPRGGEMRFLRDFGEVICRRWEEPGHGLWEVRAAALHGDEGHVLGSARPRHRAGRTRRPEHFVRALPPQSRCAGGDDRVARLQRGTRRLRRRTRRRP